MRAAVLGLSIREYTTKCLEDAVADPGFDPNKYPLGGDEVARKNITKEPELWAQVSESAAKKDVTKREYVCAAIAASLERDTVTYPTGEEKLIIDPMVLQQESIEYLQKAAGNKFSVEELISRFSEGLNQGDPRLSEWLDDQTR